MSEWTLAVSPVQIERWFTSRPYCRISALNVTSGYVIWQPCACSLILIDSLMQLGDLSLPRWGGICRILPVFGEPRCADRGGILSVRLLRYARWSHNTVLIPDLVKYSDLWIPFESRAVHLSLIELVRKLHWSWLISRSISQIQDCDWYMLPTD